MLESGKTLVCAAGGRLSVWDVSSGKQRHLLRLTGIAFDHLVFLPDSRTVAAGNGNGVVQLYDALEGKLLTDASQPTAAVRRIATCADGRTLAVVHDDYRLRFWDRSRGEATGTLGDLSSLSSLAFAPIPIHDRPALLLSKGRVTVIDVPAGKPLLEYGREIANVGRIFKCACLSPDGDAVAAVCDDGLLYLWDRATGKITANIKNAWSPSSLDFSADGKTLAMGTTNGDVVLFDRAAAKEAWRTRVETPVYFTDIRVRFIAGGRLIAAEGGNIKLALLESDTGKISYLAPLLDQPGDHFAFSPDGRMIASNDPYLSAKGIVRIYERVTGKTRLELKGHRAQVYAVAFSPDGDELLSGGSDTTVLAWDMTGRVRFGKEDWDDKELAIMAKELGQADAAKAYQSILRLALSGRSAAALRPHIVRLDAKRFRAIIARLADDEEMERQRAEAELIELGAVVLPALEAAEKERYPSAEGAERARDIAKRIRAGHKAPPTAARLQMLRAIEALERDGSAAAHALLRDLAAGMPEIEATREAADALTRLEKRRPRGFPVTKK